MIKRFFIRADHDVLTLRTSGLRRFLSLYSWDYLVTVDRYRRMVTIELRVLWRCRPKQQIPFPRISHIDYDFAVGPSGQYGRSESFTVRLSLKDPEDDVEIARFTGEHDGVVLWGDSQDGESRTFVEMLKKILGVSIGQPGPQLSGKYRCILCDRPSPPRLTKCQYCGGDVENAR